MKRVYFALWALLFAPLFLFFLTYSATPAAAIPAYPGTFVKILADGTRVMLSLRGDEHFNYYVTEEGYALSTNDAGELVYYTLAADGNLALSGIRLGAQREALHAIPRHDVLKRLDERAKQAHSALRPLRSSAAPIYNKVCARSSRATSIDGMLTNYPTIGSPRALVLLVQYQDVKFKTENANYEFNRLMNENGYDYNGATGSAFDYFRDNSCGLFTPQFIVCGPVTLPHNMAYYGAATANAHDAAPWEMVSDGCKILKEEHPELDFSQFDNDGDGFVDNVFVFYAGYGQNSGAETSTVWPHAANITWYGLKVVIDGVQIDNYACTNELTGNEVSGGNRCGIGTFCHEFSHVLGLPDLYSTNYTSAFTPGAFELMDIGPYNNKGNTPPFMSAYDRMTCKWLNPREITAAETLSLPPISENKAYMIKTILPEEYFLLENRQQTQWDTFIPGHGMLVWHIDFDEKTWSNNAVNNNPSHQRVDIIEADGLRTTESQAGDPFPGRTGVTELTDYSSPAMSTWTGTLVGCPLTEITEIDGIITFNAKGGGTGIPTVKALDAEEITPTSFRARWEGNVSIAAYEIDVCRVGEAIPFLTLTKEIKSLTECFVDVTSLTPATGYRYTVRSVQGTEKSADSNPITLTTLPPTFDMIAPEAEEAEEIGYEGFTARWKALAGAEAYVLDVYTKAYVTPIYDRVDFSEGLAALPERGWYTSATSTSGVAGTFGAARPSLLCRTDQDYITSPTYDFDINALSFWFKGNAAIEGALTVEVLVQGVWRQLDEVALSTEARTWNSEDLENAGVLLQNARRVRLTASLAAGSLYLDDISVAYNGEAERRYVEGFEHKTLNADATSYRISGLQPATSYFYTLTAQQGALTSLPSREVAVQTLIPDAIQHPVADGDATSHRPRLLRIGGTLYLQTPSGALFTLTGQRVR